MLRLSRLDTSDAIEIDSDAADSEIERAHNASGPSGGVYVLDSLEPGGGVADEFPYSELDEKRRAQAAVKVARLLQQDHRALMKRLQDGG